MADSPSTVDRTASAALAVALLGVAAGCLGAGPAASTPTPSPTPAANTDCPPALIVEEVDAESADAESAVAYDNLTAEQRETFDRARNGSVEDFDYAWHDVDFVEYRDRYYSAGIIVC
jgi:hypothetical protein